MVVKVYELLRMVLLAEGKSGDKSTYQIEVSVPAGSWKSFQMETMLHKSMKQNGPGRNTSNANPTRTYGNDRKSGGCIQTIGLDGR